MSEKTSARARSVGERASAWHFIFNISSFIVSRSLAQFHMEQEFCIYIYIYSYVESNNPSTFWRVFSRASRSEWCVRRSPFPHKHTTAWVLWCTYSKNFAFNIHTPRTHTEPNSGTAAVAPSQSTWEHTRTTQRASTPIRHLTGADDWQTRKRTHLDILLGIYEAAHMTFSHFVTCRPPPSTTNRHHHYPTIFSV